MSVKRNSYFEGWEKAIHAANAKLTAEQEKAVLEAFNGAMEDLIKKIISSRNGYLPLKIYKDFAYDLFKSLDGIINDYSKKAIAETFDSQLFFLLKHLGEDGTATASLYESKIRAASAV